MGERFFWVISFGPYCWSLLAASEEESPFSVAASFLNSSATGGSFSSEGEMLPKMLPLTMLRLSH